MKKFISYLESGRARAHTHREQHSTMPLFIPLTLFGRARSSQHKKGVSFVIMKIKSVLERERRAPSRNKRCRVRVGAKNNPAAGRIRSPPTRINMAHFHCFIFPFFSRTSLLTLVLIDFPKKNAAKISAAALSCCIFSHLSEEISL